MQATGLYGPLRWWHVGTPTPGDSKRPWGPGADLGMTDFAMVVGRTLVESGTFYDDEVGLALAAKADRLEMSPGFYYAPDWREPDGTFTDIAPFERSPVPIDYGRASNYFTGFAVKEHRMNEAERQKKLAALKAITGSDALAERIMGEVESAEKSADDARVAFKEQQPAAEPIATYELDGQLYALKDGKLHALKAPMPPEEMVEAGATELEDGAAEGGLEEAAADQALDTFVGDMTAAELKALFREVIQEAGGVLTEMDQKMAAMGYERKQKEQALEAKLADLEAKLKQATDALAALSDTATRRPYRPSLDGQESGLTADDLEARRKALGEFPSTGNPAEDALIRMAPSPAEMFHRSPLNGQS
jgi:hypothetical protein